MEWIDIGVNLTNDRFQLNDVLSRAVQAGIKSILVTGTSVAESRKALQLCSAGTPQLFCTAGVHPHYAIDVSEDFIDELHKLVQHPRVKAIGECGLDFNRNFSPRKNQIAVFEQQLELAAQVQKPVFLHEREAFDEQLYLLRKHRQQLAGGVVHCFTGNLQQMQAYLELDLYIGITGWVCDTARGADLRDALTELPLSRLLLETDAPYLRPKGLANQRKLDRGHNEPAYLPFIARQVAELMELPLQDIHDHSVANSKLLFGLGQQD